MNPFPPALQQLEVGGAFIHKPPVHCLHYTRDRFDLFCPCGMYIGLLAGVSGHWSDISLFTQMSFLSFSRECLVSWVARGIPLPIAYCANKGVVNQVSQGFMGVVMWRTVRCSGVLSCFNWII